MAKQSSLFERGLTAGRTVEVEITGPQLPQLVGIGGQMMGVLMNPVDPLIKEAQARPVPSLDLSSPEMHVTPEVIAAQSLGVNASELGYAVDALVDITGMAVGLEALGIARVTASPVALGHGTVAAAMDQARAHPRAGGALLVGAGEGVRVSCEWAA